MNTAGLFGGILGFFLSFFSAMVQQLHESHLHVVGWQIRRSASHLPAEDSHQDSEGK